MDYGNLKVPENVTPEVQAILDSYEARNKEIENAHRKKMAKQYGGAALQIGSAFIPGTLGLKGAGLAIKALTPRLGQKIAENAVTGVTSSLASGAVEGLGRGLMEGENPLKTMLSDTAISALFGGTLGVAGAKIGKKLAEKKLQNGNIAPQKYFDDYVAGLANNSTLGKQSPFSKEFNKFKGLRDSYTPVNRQSQIIFDSPDDFIDLTEQFKNPASLEDAKNFVKEANANEVAFETASPDYFLDMLGNSQKRNHIVRSNKVREMDDVDKLNHNVILSNFDTVAKGLKLTENSPQPNKKPLLKPNVKHYYNFEGDVKNGDKIIPIIANAEQYIDELDTKPLKVHLYNFYDKKFSPILNDNASVKLGENYTNSIADNLNNINPSAGLYEKIVDNSVNLQKPIPKGYMRLYRGLQEEFNPNYDKSKLDNVNGYESWTDNYDLAKAYGDNVYYIDIPENTIAKEIIDENPKSLTYGDRHLIYEHDKPVGIKNQNGKEYMLYTYHDNYPNIKYNKI